MLNAVFYKEWIKTKWFYIIAGLVLTGFAVYAGIYINRISELAGAQNLWEYFLLKGDSLITTIKYVPLITGIGGAVAQFVPEMHRKCLKLTLHLPCDSLKTVGAMILFGVVILLLYFLLDYFVLYFLFLDILPLEIRSRILQTSLPWFLAGLCGYTFGAWIVLQPKWKKRIPQMLLSVFVIKMFFITDTVGAYTRALWFFVPMTVLTALLPAVSINDFKEGKQD